MDFVVQWVWYLLAFLLGSLVAWLLAVVWLQTVGADVGDDIGEAGS